MGRQITEITARTNDILDSTKRQLAIVEEVVGDAAVRAKVQMERVELVLDDTLSRAHETVAVVHDGIMRPLREVNGIAAGIRAALRRRGPRQSSHSGSSHQRRRDVYLELLGRRRGGRGRGCRRTRGIGRRGTEGTRRIASRRIVPERTVSQGAIGSVLLHLLLHLLLCIHRPRPHNSLVLLQVVVKLPLFVLAVIVDHVDPFAIRRAGYSSNPSRIPAGESRDRRWRLARRR